jgi:predicted N-acyltransferase
LSSGTPKQICDLKLQSKSVLTHQKSRQIKVSQNNSFECRILNSIHMVSKEGWNHLLGEDATPFLRHEFLSALEDCACVGGNTGWQVAHLAIYSSGNENPIGLMPLYLKNHS